MENKLNRIEYIDAMRGLAIILVLQSHVSGLCLNIDDYTPNFHFVSGVPLFFFISGFLSKKITKCELLNIGSYIFNKAIVLLFAATIFMAFRAHITNISFADAFSAGKYGYWFTFSLFQFIMIHTACQLFFTRIKIPKYTWANDLLLLIIALFMYSLSIPIIRGRLSINENVYNLIDIGHWKFFLFFVFGTIVKKHSQLIEKVLESSFFTLIIVATFLTMTVYRDLMIQNACTLYRLLFPIIWTTICFMFFRYHQDVFAMNTIIGKFFQIIGKHTLEIYYLHILFLPRRLSEILTVFHDTPIPIIEYITTTMIVIAIIIICLVVSYFIRLSPILAHYLFGEKKQL